MTKEQLQLAAPPSLPASAPRLHFIDGLRGMAMLMVVIYHCWILSGSWAVSLPLVSRSFNLEPLLVNGHTGVNLFLVLSGFCLYWPFVKGGGRREPTLWEFAKKRCRRILPPYYATLVLFGTPFFLMALHHHSRPEILYAWNWLWLHALLAQNLSMEYVLRVDAPLWTLALEFQLYIFFPVFVEAYRRFNARGVLLAVLAANIAYRYVMWKSQVHPADYVPDYGIFYVLTCSVFGRCFEFALGMYCALIVARWHTEQKSPLRWPDYLLFALAVPMYWLDQDRGILDDAMWGLLYAALLLLASRPRSFVHAALSQRWLVSLGIFSYSIYLIHQPMVIPLSRFAARHLSGTGLVAAEVGVILPLMLGLGYVFHRLFEKPFMGAPKPRPASVPAATIVS